MDTFKTYDLRTVGVIHRTSKENPYKENTLEFFLVNFVLSLEGKSTNSIADWSDLLSQKIINEKIKDFEINSWNFHDLSLKAFWLARLSGCIVIKNEFKNSNFQFGIFYQGGLEDVLFNQNFLNKLLENKKENIYNKNSLKKALFFLQQKSSELHLPKLINNGSNIVIENLNESVIRSIKQLPIQAWWEPYPEDVDVNTRGLFHHMTDEISLIDEAKKVGDVYICGKTEFGSLIVLWSANKFSKYKVGDCLADSSLDFLYGVPYSNSAYPEKTKYFFETKINTIKNKVFSEEYWNSQVFNKYSGRESKIRTVNELLLDLFLSFEKNVSDLMNDYLNDKINFNISDHLSSFIKKNKNKNIKNLSDFIFSIKKKTKKSLEEDLVLEELLFFQKQIKLTLRSLDIKNFTDIYNKENYFFFKTIISKLNCGIIGKSEKSLNPYKKHDDNNVINFYKIIDVAIYEAIKDSSSKEFKFYLIKSFNDYVIDLLSNNTWDIKDYINYLRAIEEDAFIIQPIISMDFEYRVFVVNHKPVTTTPCFRHTTPLDSYDKIFNPRLCVGHNANSLFEDKFSREIVAKYAKFVRKFCAELKIEKPEANAYVLDVAWNSKEKKVVAIEINTLSYSGLYQANVAKIIKSMNLFSKKLNTT